MKNWFAKELIELSASAKVKLSVYVTRTFQAEPVAIEEQIPTLPRISTLEELEKHVSDPEKSPSASERSASIVQGSSLPVMSGRPDISATIRAIVAGTEEEERTIIAACGPESMMKETRAIAGELVASSGRSITLHCEQFGW